MRRHVARIRSSRGLAYARCTCGWDFEARAPRELAEVAAWVHVTFG